MTLSLHLVPHVLCVVGLLLYGLCQGKISEVGRLLFFGGLLGVVEVL